MDLAKVSLVIQGPILDHKVFEETILRSYRAISAELEIIVSTWSDTCFKSDLVDIYVESKDPGAVIVVDENGVTNSTSRILVSSRAGLEKATRNWILKVRSDVYFSNLDWLVKYKPQIIPKSFRNRIFNYKVLGSTYFTPNPKRQKVLFHPGDWLFFGHKDDLLEYFGCALPKEPENSRYFFDKKNPRPSCYTWHKTALSRYTCEQYPLLMLMHKNKISIPSHGFEFDENWCVLHESIFGVNFSFLSGDTISLISVKHRKFYKSLDLSTMYTNKETQLLSKKSGFELRLPFFDYEKFRRIVYAISLFRPFRMIRVLKSFSWP